MEMNTPSVWHRKQALLLVAQLPDSYTDAVMVLEAARELLETFLNVPVDRGSLGATLATNVLPFISG